MVFVLALLAWFTLLVSGIGLIVATEPWWNRASLRPLARSIPLASRRRAPYARGTSVGEPCLDRAA